MRPPAARRASGQRSRCREPGSAGHRSATIRGATRGRGPVRQCGNQGRSEGPGRGLDAGPRRTAAQPAGLADELPPGNAAREHRDRRRPGRLHPRSAGDPAATRPRAHPHRELRSRHPDRRHGRPVARPGTPRAGAPAQPAAQRSGRPAAGLRTSRATQPVIGSTMAQQTGHRSADRPVEVRAAARPVSPPPNGPADAAGHRGPGRGPAQPEVHLRDLRHRSARTGSRTPRPSRSPRRRARRTTRS